MNIVDKIRLINDLFYIDGCTDVQVEGAEKLLDLKFPREYIDYVKEFGCIDFGSTEWTGLNIEGELNTVEATLLERECNKSFPDKHFVLDNYHIDNKMIIVNEIGQVFLLQHKKIEKICETISEYLDICILNNF